MNHAIVDEKGLIYANDRFTGGLYILDYRRLPLDCQPTFLRLPSNINTSFFR